MTSPVQPTEPRVVEVLRAERDGARAQRDRVIAILTGIHALLASPRISDPKTGLTYEYQSPDAQKQLQWLSDRIRAIPDELAAHPPAPLAAEPVARVTSAGRLEWSIPWDDAVKFIGNKLYAHPSALSEKFIQETLRLHVIASNAQADCERLGEDSTEYADNWASARAALESHLRGRNG